MPIDTLLKGNELTIVCPTEYNTGNLWVRNSSTYYLIAWTPSSSVTINVATFKDLYGSLSLPPGTYVAEILVDNVPVVSSSSFDLQGMYSILNENELTISWIPEYSNTGNLWVRNSSTYYLIAWTPSSPVTINVATFKDLYQSLSLPPGTYVAEILVDNVPVVSSSSFDLYSIFELPNPSYTMSETITFSVITSAQLYLCLDTTRWEIPKGESSFIFKNLVDAVYNGGIQQKTPGYGYYISDLNSLNSNKFTITDPGDKLVLTYGNVSCQGWSTLGGSRLILGTVKDAYENIVAPLPSIANDSSTPPNALFVPKKSYGSANSATYLNLDCSKQVNISVDLNLKYTRPGIVTVLYLVPMYHACRERNKTQTKEVSYCDNYLPIGIIPTLNPANSAPVSFTKVYSANNKVITDDLGLGYCDAQGVGAGQSIEIDCIEATPCSFACTLHGRNGRNETVGNTLYDRPGYYCSVHGFTGNGSASYAGVLNSYVMKIDENDIETRLTTYDATTYGPSSDFFINTLNTFSVYIILNNNTVLDSNGKLTMTVTIVQNNRKIKMYVESEGFSIDEDIDKMNVILADWATTQVWPTKYEDVENANFSRLLDDIPNNGTDYKEFQPNVSWWLDGYNIEASDAKNRAWCTPNKSCRPQDAAVVPSAVANLHEVYKDYSLYSTPVQSFNYYNLTTPAAEYSPSVSVFSALHIYSDSYTMSSNVLPVYIMDIMFRGISNDKMLTNWTGRYDSGYATAYDINGTGELNAETGFIPEPTDAKNGLAFYNYQKFGQIFNPISYSYGLKMNMSSVSEKELYCFNPVNKSNLVGSDKYYNTNITNVGMNYMDAPGVKINNILFTPTTTKTFVSTVSLQTPPLKTTTNRS